MHRCCTFPFALAGLYLYLYLTLLCSQLKTYITDVAACLFVHLFYAVFLESETKGAENWCEPNFSWKGQSLHSAAYCYSGQCWHLAGADIVFSLYLFYRAHGLRSLLLLYADLFLRLWLITVSFMCADLCRVVSSKWFHFFICKWHLSS